MRGAWVFVSVVLLAAACDRFESGEAARSAHPDAGSTTADAGTPIDAAKPEPEPEPDGGVGLGTNLVEGGDFEGALGGECGGNAWTSYQATSKVVEGGKAGANACSFCGVPGKGFDFFTMNAHPFAAAVPGEKLVAHAWFKLAKAADVRARLVIRAWDSKSANQILSEGGETLTASTDWIELDAALVVPANVADDYGIDAYVAVSQYDSPDLPPCAFTDDIRVSRVE